MCFELVGNLAKAPVFVGRRAEMKDTLCAASLQEIMIDHSTSEGCGTVLQRKERESRRVYGADSSRVSGVSTAANGSSASTVVGKADGGAL